MQHSVKEIAKRYSELSTKRKDKKLFKFDDFINFAKENKKKYSLIDNGEDLLVSTWYSDDLIEDYRNTLKHSQVAEW
jgi:hypothetical protein